MDNLVADHQSSTQDPAKPAYVLRGHKAQIHAALFLRDNLRLLTGDAEGWVVLWNLVTRRAVAVWRAHEKSILGFGSWDLDKIITHGRDNKLHTWQIHTREDEDNLSTVLPIDHKEESNVKQPWLLYSLDVNALNFCSFALCQDFNREPTVSGSTDILIATPGVQDGHINITSLPDCSRVATIPSPNDTNTGMVMAIGLSFLASEEASCASTSPLLVFGGYESGHACVWRKMSPANPSTASSPHPPDSTRLHTRWQLIYIHNAHTQPILSLCISSEQKAFYTSSADAIIARHSIPLEEFSEVAAAQLPSRVVQTKHAGQQSIQIRADNRIYATAGWDGRARVYSVKTMKEVAVLKWHNEGCYALAFAETRKSPPIEVVRTSSSSSVAVRRMEATQNTHWLALGSKDGKVSLWDIF